MVKDLNERLRECRQNIALKEVLEKKKSNLERELFLKEEEIKDFEKVLNKELKDVEKLKSVSFSNLIASVFKNKEEKLKKEEEEYLEAKLKYDKLKFSLDNLKIDLEKIEEDLKKLRGTSKEYKELIEEKRELIKKFNLKVREEIVSLEKDIERETLNKKEIEEALLEAKNCLSLSEESLKILSSAKNWGIYDIVGGGMISSYVKQNKIDEAKTYMERLSYSIGNLNKELGDLNIEFLKTGLNINGLSYTFDIFLDNIFSDLSVQGEIKDSLYKLEDFKNKLFNLINKLEKEEKNKDLKLNLLNEKLLNIIEEN